MQRVTDFHQPTPDIKEYRSQQEIQEREGSPAKGGNCNPFLAFEKNYPKNIFITLIQHLGERGLRSTYQQCVGTRQSFESKNVVSLAEIHKLISQSWFGEVINLTALVATMSNKILMNSKIKKKLFHLLLIKELFSLPPSDCKNFKKIVSKKANEITASRLPAHPLFHHPSALIYLLRLLAQGIQKGSGQCQVDLVQSDQFPFEQQINKANTGDQREPAVKKTQKQPSSKQESKLYINKIISNFNRFAGDLTQLFDILQEIKMLILEKQLEIRQMYKLPKFVPQWNHFNMIVIDNCMKIKRSRQRLTFSMFNQWIMEFRDMSTSNKGFLALNEYEQIARVDTFRPIILIRPPQSVKIEFL